MTRVKCYVDYILNPFDIFSEEEWFSYKQIVKIDIIAFNVGCEIE